MTEINYPQIAALVYQACNSYDAYMPALSVDMATAWGKTFKKFQMPVDLLIKGVDRVYEEHGSGYRPLPKDIVDAARAIRREEDAKTGPTPEYAELCESKYISYEDALRQVRARTGQAAIGRGL